MNSNFWYRLGDAQSAGRISRAHRPAGRLRALRDNAHLKALGSILRVLSLVHLVFVTIGLLTLLYLVTYFYLIQAFDFPKDFSYAKFNAIHRQVLNHPIDDRDAAYLFLFVFAFIADNAVLRAGKCMKVAEEHSMAVIGVAGGLHSGAQHHLPAVRPDGAWAPYEAGGGKEVSVAAPSSRLDAGGARRLVTRYLRA